MISLTRSFLIAVMMFILILLMGFASPTAPTQDSAKAGKGEFPDSMYFYDKRRPKKFREMEGKPTPKLRLRDWIGEPVDLSKQKGKVVVVDYWATWCGPCVKSIPHNIDLYNDYREQGLVFLGIHDSRRGWKNMPSFAKSRKINYPMAVDVDGRSTKGWNVSFWPTYFVIDRKGIIRAAGLKPIAVEKVVEKLLAEGKNSDSPEQSKKEKKDFDTITPNGDGSNSIPSAWNERSPQKAKMLGKLLAKGTPPPIESPTWINSDTLHLDELKGKVVLLDFWATWCAPCLKSIPHNNKLAKKFGDEGLVVIGICHPRGAEKMGQVANRYGIQYPICADPSGAMNRAYRVDGYPDYYLIDRTGRLRIADCKNNKVEAAIELLLAEREDG